MLYIIKSLFHCSGKVLGHVCYHILAAGLNGYMATVTNLKSPVNEWKCGAAPITVSISVIEVPFNQIESLP
jgi:pyrophosphate--fructose-6-phosphate 1-phosphotransferase